VNVKKEHLTAITAAKFSYAFGILSFINAPKPRSITEPSVGGFRDRFNLHCIYPSLEVTRDSSRKGSLTVEPAHGVRSNGWYSTPLLEKAQQLEPQYLPICQYLEKG